MTTLRRALPLLLLPVLACTEGPSSAPKDVPQDAAPVPVQPAPVPTAEAKPKTEPKAAEPREGHLAGVGIKRSSGAIPPSPARELAAYLEANLPMGGKVETSTEAVRVVHTVQAGQTLADVVAAYLPLSDLYYPAELTSAIARKNPGRLVPGKTIEIPNVTTRVIRDPKAERLGWPEDSVMKGVFVTGPYAGIKWVDTLDRMAARGLNAVVLDGKDYMGYVNYPTKAKIAVETDAVQILHIPDLARAIRFAHWRGIHVIIRIPCFHDPWADKHAKDARLSLKFTPTGKPIHVEWIDPTNAEAQDYAVELAQEAVDAGADEVQLDYVRFPVHISRKTAVLPPIEDRRFVIRDFVKRVKHVTMAAGAGLSLDFFGVAATGERSDILALGQDIAIVAPEADAISLMSYPSHYRKGYMGWTEPADHPEVIALGNKAAIGQLAPTGAKTIWRTWLQAFPLHVTHYGASYVVAQAKQAELSGGTGWLMWSPGCEYSAVWNGFPPVKQTATVAEADVKDMKKATPVAAKQ